MAVLIQSHFYGQAGRRMGLQLLDVACPGSQSACLGKLMLKLRHEADDSPDHFQVYSGQVRIGTIYKTSGNPTGNQWYWGLNGVENGPGPFNGFVRTLDDAMAKFAAAWGAWLKAAGLNEDTPTAKLKDSDSGPT
jgi:hypothetical protein